MKLSKKQKHATQGLKTEPYKRVGKKWEVQQVSEEDQEEEVYSIGIERKLIDKLPEFESGIALMMSSF